MLNLLKKLFKEEEGQGMVEYGLIIALIAIVVITALSLLGGKLTAVFTKIKDSITP
jgi:pilus assembly protein Flp/PilA